MSHEAEATTTGPGVKLPKDKPGNFSPSEIVYTRYSYDRTKPDGERVIPDPGSHVVRNMSIEDFINSRVKGGPLPPADCTYKQPGDDSAPQRPINIFVSEQCWLVIELDPSEKWQFSPGEPGITTRKDHQDDNWGLTHVMPGGQLVGSEGPTGDGCLLIYFGVNARCKNEHQRFLCNIDMSQLGFRDDPVDPDIPNDGGKFPFPLFGKPCPEDE